MKIAINRCYGSYGGVSSKLVERALEIGWQTTEYDEEGNYKNPRAEIVISPSESRLVEDNITRTNKVLISLIEELGEEANTMYSRYVIVDIPDNVEWEIEEYDGLEWVSEKHRIWD
jgi:hypothetical protein